MNWHMSQLGSAVLFLVAVFCLFCVGGFVFGFVDCDFMTAFWPVSVDF